ncbi:MAG: sugar transferase [Propylenella sp.]
MDYGVASEVTASGINFANGRYRVAAPGQWSGERLFDIVVGSAGLIVAAPILVAAAVLIWLQDGGSIIYTQTRVGKDGVPFCLFKFRTMRLDADACLVDLRASDPRVDLEWRQFQKLRNDPRITPIGALLRRCCIDELPQLLNVLLGEMSIVGPRPIAADQIVDYGRSLQSYAMVRPGLTGLWQVSRGRSPSFRGRVAADRLYLRRKSFLRDLWIILRTVPVVVLGRGCH